MLALELKSRNKIANHEKMQLENYKTAKKTTCKTNLGTHPTNFPQTRTFKRRSRTQKFDPKNNRVQKTRQQSKETRKPQITGEERSIRTENGLNDRKTNKLSKNPWKKERTESVVRTEKTKTKVGMSTKAHQKLSGKRHKNPEPNAYKPETNGDDRK